MAWQPMITAPAGWPLLLFGRLLGFDAPVVLIGHFLEGRWMTCNFVGQESLEVEPLAWMPIPTPPIPARRQVANSLTPKPSYDPGKEFRNV